MNWPEFAFWLLCGLMTVLVSGVGWFLHSLISEIKAMRMEMQSLNEKLVQVVVNQDWHGKEINRLEKRVETMEHNIGREN
jgi:Tfp pilus assembly protein PilO